MLFANSSIASFDSPVRANPSGVLIGPGLTAFTRIPRPTSSAAIERVNDRSAALVVDINNFVLKALARRRQRRKLVNPCIDKQHVDLSELLRDRRIQLVQVGRIGHIGLHRQHAVADRLDRISQCLGVASRNGYSRAFFLQPLRRRQPDAAVSSGYYRHFSFQSLHWYSPVSSSLLNGSSQLRYLDDHLTIRLHQVFRSSRAVLFLSAVRGLR